METMRELFSIIISGVLGVILVGALSPVLQQLGAGAFIPLLWVIVIITVIGGIVILIKKSE